VTQSPVSCHDGDCKVAVFWDVTQYNEKFSLPACLLVYFHKPEYMDVQFKFLSKFYNFISMAETVFVPLCYGCTNKTEFNSWPYPVAKINIMASTCVSNAPGTFYELIYTVILYPGNATRNEWVPD
jgi:hypothetical protein